MADDDVIKRVDEVIQRQAIDKPLDRLTELSKQIDDLAIIPEIPPLELDKLRAISDKLIEPELAVHIVENAHSAIVVARKDGLLYYLNREAEFLFGYTREELFDKPILTLVPERFKPGHTRGWNKWLEKPTLRPASEALHTVGRRKDGGEVPITISILPVVIVAGFFVVAIIRQK